jgi:hypothetical protein
MFTCFMQLFKKTLIISLQRINLLFCVGHAVFTWYTNVNIKHNLQKLQDFKGYEAIIKCSLLAPGVQLWDGNINSWTALTGFRTLKIVKSKLQRVVITLVWCCVVCYYIIIIITSMTALCEPWLSSGFLKNLILTVWGCQPHVQPPTWRTVVCYTATKIWEENFY